MSLPIYVIGSSNTDMVVKAERLPSPGETIIGGAFMMNAGGKGANQAVAAARLGGNVTFIANVGADIFGKQALRQFQNENINIAYVTTDKDQPSGVALINVDNKGENCIVVAPGANAGLSVIKASMALNSITATGIVLLQQEIPMETVEYVIEDAVRKKHLVILNPAPANTLSPGAFPNLFLISPNETEAELLTGIKVTDEETAATAAAILRSKGVQHVVITLGSRGAFISTGSVKKIIPAPAVTAADTTAAGDCFNGALAVAIAEGVPLEGAVSFACKAASISVTRMGAQSSMPFRKEVEEIPLVKVDTSNHIQL